ncbi:sugar O-acetyltransferase [Nesterenkonia aurantiaca]|uniref:Maltose O-acetyltransferase n=1 Tax=Nesterenkonia aurantiaca TaxID=1436010 RepID=A0A4V3ECR3_9MICC|nr:sugar O-acetyltransferase [Nesterenkonia aurantiaca]TDS87481.1 maltose O-acetyltransferase [Nesterenkonia aurantiaca]
MGHGSLDHGAFDQEAFDHGAFADDHRTQYQRLRDGHWYRADAEILERASAAHRLAHRYNQAAAQGEEDAAAALLPQLIGELGDDVAIRAPFSVDYGSHISIGDRVFINTGLVALDVAPIRIGADCLLGPNVQLLTPIHPVEPGPRQQKWESAEPITLEENVWLGGGVIVCPGVTIGRNAVIGAGAVVTRDIPANSVAVGNPARVIRQCES